MQALMLAAGIGKRLGRYTKNGTKCMVQVNGKALIEYAIESLVQNGIKKFILVVGYKSDVLIDFINSKFNAGNLNGMQIEFIQNEIYDKTNNIYSLFIARERLCDDDTILLESDLIYKPELITRLIESKDPNIAVVSRFEPWMDGTCTILDKNCNITGMVDKAAFNWSETGNYYKTVNIYKFSKDFSKNYYIPFLEAYQKAFGKNEYYEQVLKVLSFLSSSTLKGMPVSGEDWYEIDDPADLEIAENRFADRSKKLSLLEQRQGGYWRFPKLKDFCNPVNPYFPPQKMVDELQASFKTLLTHYPSGTEQISLLAGKIFNILPENIIAGNFTADDIQKALQAQNAKTEILVNPDNPSGKFLRKEEVLSLLAKLKKEITTLIFDESFIDFADSAIRYTLLNQEIIEKYDNLIVIKSISKSYGITGLRLGILATKSTAYINKIRQTNSIWNINSFAEYSLQIFEKYKASYTAACDSIAQERSRFVKELSQIPWMQVYPSQSNFVLCRLISGHTAGEIAVKLLEKNIFIKDLTKEKGFDGSEYISLAVRDTNDNNLLIDALKQLD